MDAQPTALVHRCWNRKPTTQRLSYKGFCVRCKEGWRHVTQAIARGDIAILLVLVACGDGDSSVPDGGGRSRTDDCLGRHSDAGGDRPCGVELDVTNFGGETPLSGVEVTLAFMDGQAGGNAGCNEYGGAYATTSDAGFEMTDTFTTKRKCTEPAGIMELETDYLVALADAVTYRDGIDRLELANAAGETILSFVRDTRSELAGTTWTLVTFDDHFLIDNTHITLAFGDGEVSGSASCNTYGGTYTSTTDGDLTISELVVTEMACPTPPGVMEQEQAFLTAFATTTGYRIDAVNNRLELLTSSDQPRIVFSNDAEPLGTGILDGTDWVLATLNGVDVPDGKLFTLILRSSQFAGKADCISYLGAITTTPDGGLPDLRVFEGGGQCDGVDAPEAVTEYLAALDDALTFRLSSDRLELLDTSGVTTLVYRPGAPDARLIGTTWELLMLDGVEPLEGTTITLSFVNGWVGGESGCNSYSGGYMVLEPDVLSLPGFISTSMGCDDPPGVLEQEATYHHTLLQAVTYRVTAHRLEL